MVRKITAIALLLIICLSICACSGNKPNEPLVTEPVVLEPSRFTKEFADVTDELVDLGINNEIFWKNSDMETIIARNPYDMITHGNKVFVSGGNYNSNKGPVVINAYTRDCTEGIDAGAVSTEQVNEFYQYNGYTIALGIDPKEWMAGDIYYIAQESNRWKEHWGVLKGNIHCYDMVEYKGSYYFGGSNLNYRTKDGVSYEASIPAVFKLEGEFTDNLYQQNFVSLDIVVKNGKVITYDNTLEKLEVGDSVYWVSQIPRIHNLMVFNDKLLAICYCSNGEGNSGIYEYNEKKNRFEYADEYNAEFLIEIYNRNKQDREKIQHDFQWGSKYYFVAAGLYSTADFKEYTTETIPKYEDCIVRDVIFRDGYAIVLAGKEVEDGVFENIVFETADFKEYRPLLSFETPLFARSFEYCDGAFFFGIGFDSVYARDENGNIYYDTVAQSVALEKPKNYTDCGRIYRYIYE